MKVDAQTAAVLISDDFPASAADEVQDWLSESLGLTDGALDVFLYPASPAHAAAVKSWVDTFKGTSWQVHLKTPNNVRPGNKKQYDYVAHFGEHADRLHPIGTKGTSWLG